MLPLTATEVTSANGGPIQYSTVQCRQAHFAASLLGKDVCLAGVKCSTGAEDQQVDAKSRATGMSALACLLACLRTCSSRASVSGNIVERYRTGRVLPSGAVQARDGELKEVQLSRCS